MKLYEVTLLDKTKGANGTEVAVEVEADSPAMACEVAWKEYGRADLYISNVRDLLFRSAV